MSQNSSLPPADADSQDMLYRGNFFQFLSVQTPAGPRECIRRRDNTIKATQVLPLWLDSKAVPRGLQLGALPKARFAQQLIASGIVGELCVELLGVQRAITHFQEFNWQSDTLVEIVGGVSEEFETDEMGGIRELREELRLSEQQVLCWTTLAASMPYDAGAHIESTAIMAVVYTGDYQIPRAEGIVPEACRRLPFLECREHLEQCLEKGIPVQGFAHAALTELLFLLCGGSTRVQEVITSESTFHIE